MVKAQSIIVIYDSLVILISFSGSPFEILVSASITTPNVKARLCICQGWWNTAKKKKKKKTRVKKHLSYNYYLNLAFSRV